MSSFHYIQATDLEQACTFLSREENTYALGGGTDLLHDMKKGVMKADTLVDIKEIDELNVFHQDDVGNLHIGAAKSVHLFEEADIIAENYPALAKAASTLGSYPIRCKATIGGNICQASPSADLIPALLIYEGIAQIYGEDGFRCVPLKEFFTAPNATVLKKSEILVKVVLDAPAQELRAKYIKYSPRRAMDLAVVGIAAGMGRDNSGQKTIRMALGAVAPTPIRAYKTEEAFLKDDTLSWNDLGTIAASECSPISDMRASKKHRLRMVEVLASRVLEELSDQTRGV